MAAHLLPRPATLRLRLRSAPQPARLHHTAPQRPLRLAAKASVSEETPPQQAPPPDQAPREEAPLAAKKKTGRPAKRSTPAKSSKLSNQLQAERAERTARNTQLRDMSIRQSTLLDIGKALERRTNTSLSRLQQEAADKAPDEDQQLQMEQLIVEMDDLVERLRSKVAWLDMAKHELPNNKKKSSRNRQPGLMG